MKKSAHAEIESLAQLDDPILTDRLRGCSVVISVYQEGEGLSKLLDRAHRWLFVAVAALLCVSLFAPVMTTAAQDAASGTTVIANTGGDGATLRADAGVNAPAITTLAEGIEVIVLAGPVSDPEGNSWFQVSAQGSTGYVSAAFVGSGSNTAATTPDPTSTQAALVTEPTSPQVETPTGPSAPEWANPIDHGVVVNNANQGGLPADGLAVRVSASPDAEVIDRVYTGDRLDVTSQKIWTGDTPYYQVNFGNGGGFVNAWFLTLDSEAVPATEAPTEVVTEVPTEVVTQAPAEIVTEAPTEVVSETPTDVVTDAPTDVVTEAPTEVVTQAPVEVPSATPTDVVADAPANVAPATPTDAAAGIPVVMLTSIATVVPAETDQVSGTPEVTDAPTDEVVVASTPTVTDVPANEVVVAGTPAITDVPANEVVVAGTPAATVTTTDTEAVPATPAEVTAEKAQTTVTSPLNSMTAIGSATVTGTNGEGIRCRTAPDSSASTIVVLAEGTKVQVYGAPGNGWLQIGCGDQLGFGNINYLWSGGASDGDINSGGRLSVSGTGGGLNCRTGAGTSFSVIAVIADGTAVTIRGQAANGWTPVTCAGQNGFVSSDYISVSPITDGGNTGGSTGAGTVSGTGGDGVRCRTGASTNSTVILVVGEGTTVTIRGASSNGWTPVTCGGQNGYISSQYLTAGSGGNPAATKTPVPGGGGASSGNVIVTGSGGGVNCRSGAGLNYSVVAVVADGATVPTRSGSTNGWQAVTCNGQNGFILGDLTTPTQGGGGATTPTPAPGNGGGSVTGTATVTGTGGDGVRCRVSAPNGNPIAVLPEGTTVSLRGSASNGWQPVVCGGQNGFVSSQYLTSGGGSTAPGTTPTPPPATGGLVANDHALVEAEVNLRYEPSLGSGVSIVVPSGIVVLITGNATSGFYPVNYDGLKGYMSADYLSKTSAELSKRGGSGNPGTTPAPAPGNGGGGSATGNAMVNFAMGYLGYPYVWATHGPSSFDCSGFTYWVALNVLGIDIGTGTWTQSVSGTPVSRASLQPGDLVFFQNTYEAGLSHVGIYIGNDQFIHAENENTGVRISDLNSQYYSSRWYGAVRLG